MFYDCHKIYDSNAVTNKQIDQLGKCKIIWYLFAEAEGTGLVRGPGAPVFGRRGGTGTPIGAVPGTGLQQLS